MTIKYWPFDTGAGASVLEEDWTKMARHWLSCGVLSQWLNEMEVYADSTGMQAKVKSGMFHILGHFYENDAEETVAISASDGSNPRIDVIVAEVDWTNNDCDIAVVAGTPGATPAAPTLTQSASLWQIPLAYIAVGAGVSTIAAGNVTDRRVMIGRRIMPANFVIGSGEDTINTGYAGHILLPAVPLKILEVNALGDASGSIQIDIWLREIASGVPTNTQSITASDPFTISTAVYGKKTTFTGWSQEINAYKGQVYALGFNVDSVSTFKQITLQVLMEEYEV